MIKYIKNPHLPKGKLRQMIIGEKYREKLEKSLCDNNIEVFWMPDNPFADKRLSGHVDLSIVHLGENKLALTEYLSDSDLAYSLSENGFEIIKLHNPDGREYPEDARYNVCVIDDKLIANEKTADRTLLDYFSEKELISCRQGYSKCSVCIADENSIITADKKIAEKSLIAGLSVLTVDNGIVRLEGFEFGFIGGASFKISKDELAFTGIIKNEFWRNRIEAFLIDRNIKAVYLTDEEIFDIGSAVLLTEE